MKEEIIWSKIQEITTDRGTVLQMTDTTENGQINQTIITQIEAAVEVATDLRAEMNLEEMTDIHLEVEANHKDGFLDPTQEIGLHHGTYQDKGVTQMDVATQDLATQATTTKIVTDIKVRIDVTDGHMTREKCLNEIEQFLLEYEILCEEV